MKEKPDIMSITAQSSAEEVALAIAIDNIASIATLSTEGQAKAWRKMERVAALGQVIAEEKNDATRAAHFWMARWVLNERAKGLEHAH